jgi:predicted DNA-binding WGR domain protein
MKFWAIQFVPWPSLPGTAVRIFWGRIGTMGQDKTFPPPGATVTSVLEDAEKRLQEKLREGYVQRSEIEGWTPRFISESSRAPGTGRPDTAVSQLVEALARSEDAAMMRSRPLQPSDWNGEDWPVRNGRPVRPRSRGESRTLDPLEARDYFPTPARSGDRLATAPRTTRGFDLAGRERDRTVVTLVTITSERVIDFED